MAATSIDYVRYPRVPNNYNEFQSFPLVTDGSLNLNLRDGQTVASAPVLAVASSLLTDKGVKLLINGGVTNANDLGKFKAMFYRDGNIQDVHPGKSLPEFTREECWQVAQLLWQTKGPFGTLSGEPQESGSKWRMIYKYAPQQYLWILEGFQRLKNSVAPDLVLGGNYDGASTLWASKIDETTLRNAMSSTAGALALLKQFEWDSSHYWTSEQWRYDFCPLLNVYVTQASNWEQLCQTYMRMELFLMALREVGKADLGVYSFSWTRCDAGLLPYSELHKMDLGGGVSSLGVNFPDADPNIQLEQCANALDRGKHLCNWENPYIAGSDKNKLIAPITREDGYPMYRIQGDTSGRKTGIRHDLPAPFVPGTDYGFPDVPMGYMDLAITGAKMSSLAKDFCDAEALPVRHKTGSGTGSLKTTGPEYWPDSIYGHKPLVRMRTKGNRRLVTIFDVEGKDAYKGEGILQVDTGSGIETLEYLVGVRNQIEITY